MSEINFNLDQSKILSSCNELSYYLSTVSMGHERARNQSFFFQSVQIPGEYWYTSNIVLADTL